MQLPDISISLLAANFYSISDIIKEIDNKFGLHLDFMDGTYSDSFGLPSSWTIESEHFIAHHYMTQNIYNLNCHSIVVPYEKINILRHFNGLRGIWTDRYLTIKEEDLNYIDYILLLCVKPGFCGQKFNNESWDIAAKLFQSYNKTIQLDGGLNEEKISKALSMNYKIVTGSYGIKYYI